MSVPLLDIAAIRALETALAASLPPGTLMERAGAAAARGLLRDRPIRTALVLCGPGNNGGDGYVLARHLRAAGCKVQVIAPAAPTTNDARRAATAWQAAGGTVFGDPGNLSMAADVVVDALFGIGLQRPLAAPWTDLLRSMTRMGRWRVALDVPSGLDADRGTWVGGVAGVPADVTITFLADKPGLHTAAGCDAAGQVQVETLGACPAAGEGALLGPDDFATLLRPRARDSHKGRFGDVAIIGGAAGMTGAAMLAARAALRLGAGRVYVGLLDARAPTWDSAAPELMLRDVAALPPTDVTVVGCGIGEDHTAKEAVGRALQRPGQLVLDADALNLSAADSGLRATVRARTAPVICTPHPLEAARLLGIDAVQVQADRIDAARALTRELGCWTVLKGAGTVIAAPSGAWWINPTGSAALATAGSGDVLAGMLGALVAQCDDVAAGVLGAVWLHGAAATGHGGDIGLVADEIAALAVAELVEMRRAGAFSRT